MVLIAATFMAAVLAVSVAGSWWQAQWVGIQFHSAIEAAGALVFLVKGILRLTRDPDLPGGACLSVALGLIALGILDEFHAITAPGESFVLTREIAALAGGLGFGLAWLPAPPSLIRVKYWISGVVVALAVAAGFVLTVYADHFPPSLLSGGQGFTPFAISISLVGFALYLIGTVLFAYRYVRTGNPEAYVLTCIAGLLGLASLYFYQSTIWGGTWWIWHFTRLLAGVFALAYIIHSYMRLVAHLRHTAFKLEASNLELEATSEQLKETVDKLRLTAHDLETTNQELTTFAYSVSHDLRAPLRAVDGFSQALLEDYDGRLDDTGRDYLHRLRAGAQRMAQLIDDVLVLSRATRAELTRQDVSLSELAQEVAAGLREREPQREVTLAIQPGVRAFVDRRLMQQVLENLLSNAWKFTGKAGQASIEFGTKELNGGPDNGRAGQLAYFVRDNGAGFDMRYVDKLFLPFQRLHQADEFPGNGIGLATVQRIIARHGGQIWAAGELGRGAEFSFTLD
jgi:signal transduction histidine kinase